MILVNDLFKKKKKQINTVALIHFFPLHIFSFHILVLFLPVFHFYLPLQVSMGVTDLSCFTSCHKTFITFSLTFYY